MTLSLSGEGYSLKVGSFSFGSPVNASAVSKPIFYIKANEVKTNIYTPVFYGLVKNVISFGSIYAIASPKRSDGGFTTYSRKSRSVHFKFKFSKWEVNLRHCSKSRHSMLVVSYW